MMDQDFFHAIRTGAVRLNGTELRVWAALVDEATLGNMVTKTQTEMAKHSGLNVTHFNKALQSLMEKDMVVRCPEEGRYHNLMLSPVIHWKGKAEFHKSAVAKYRNWRGL